jgi:hypothetical protein
MVAGPMRRVLAVAVFGLVVSIGTPSLLHGDPGQSTDPDVAAALVATLRPDAIPESVDPDIPNPMRGMQGYLGGDQPLSDGVPYVDSYSRDNLFWYELEPSEGVYNFSQLDTYLAEAAAHGGKYGFRIMAVDYSNARHQGPFVPQYVWNRMPGAYQWNTPDGTIFMPDFDDPNFLARARALIAAIGARYANDPRLGWVEPGLLGLYGEWHVGNAPKVTRGTLAHQAWSVESGKQIVDAWRTYLPGKRLIMLTADFEVLDYALGLDPRVGWRHDCLGSPNLDALQQNQGYLNHPDQWKTAPIFWESCGAGASQALSHDQVIRYHFAGGHPMNGPQLAKLSPADQALLSDYRKLAGYRFQLDSVTVPAVLSPGSSFSVVWNWSNEGVTPAYTPWLVRLQLRDHQTNVAVFDQPSELNLQAVLPTRDPNADVDAPLGFVDTFSLGSDVAAATYDVVVAVTDPTGYYRPLALANAGRRADGSYVLGSINVGS